MKTLALSLTLATACSASAETLFVVGSYQSAERSNLARDKINGKLDVPLSVSVVQGFWKNLASVDAS